MFRKFEYVRLNERRVVVLQHVEKSRNNCLKKLRID